MHKLSYESISVPPSSQQPSMDPADIIDMETVENINSDEDIPLDVTSDFNTEEYAPIVENIFTDALQNPLSTFSIDVDKASYANMRRFINSGQLPPPGSVRLEELINYFNYQYHEPENDQPFSINTEYTNCPWNTQKIF